MPFWLVVVLGAVAGTLVGLSAVAVWDRLRGEV